MKQSVHFDFFFFYLIYSFVYSCPVDGEIMGQFTYNEDKTEARVNFQAHKFPYTASVYYQCNVRLCIKHDGGCSNTVHNPYDT